jgi:hypothetical protein
MLQEEKMKYNTFFSYMEKIMLSSSIPQIIIELTQRDNFYKNVEYCGVK